MSDFDEKLLNRLHLVEREIERLKRWEHKSKAEFDAEYLGLTAQAADSHKVDGAHASATPTASTVPIADGAGKLAVGWTSTSAVVANPTWTTIGTPFTNQPVGVSCTLITIGAIRILLITGQCHAISGGTGIFVATFGAGVIPSLLVGQLICSSHNLSTAVSGFAGIEAGLVVSCSKDNGVALATNSEYFRVDIMYM